ncbi:MAG: non-canonical purine NTP pyrophosphatase, partial [Endomicrobium sp.]|nr:non-canonical purine NTP pyrophosphatase [Endomicrobium sp.]
AGEDCSYDDSNQKLLEELEGVPEEKRTAKLRTVVAISSPGWKISLFDGEISGIIKDNGAGDNGFAHDSLFYIPEYRKTLAELSFEEKNSISPRARALQKLKEHIKVIEFRWEEV